MLQHNLTVHGLWIGQRLSLMEQLTLRSFVACGHRFVLWAYDSFDSDVPTGVMVRDASEVLTREKVFRYEGGMFPGSYAGFSDIFRYKLLYDHGGWWTDMDIACLKALDFDQPYAFHPAQGMGLVGAMLKAPPKSDLMHRCFEWASRNVNAQNTDWVKPIRILVDEVRGLGLAHYILPPTVVSADWRDGERFATTGALLPEGYHLIHWCNEWQRAHGFDKDRPIPGTAYAALMKKHGLA